MKAGTYYVGDLCYLIPSNEWDDFCDLLTQKEVHGEWSGKKFYSSQLLYGDGTYRDLHGLKFEVDSGTLGCFPIEPGHKKVRGGHITIRTGG